MTYKISDSFFFFWGLLLLGKCMYSHSTQLKSLFKPIRNLTVKENHIGSTVSEVLSHIHRNILLLLLKYTCFLSMMSSFLNDTPMTSSSSLPWRNWTTSCTYNTRPPFRQASQSCNNNYYSWEPPSNDNWTTNCAYTTRPPFKQASQSCDNNY